MLQRTDRVRAQIKQEVSDIIQKELRDPRIGFVTITDAEVTVDLRHATVFFSVYGDEAETAQTTEALNRAAGFIRLELGKRVRIKYVPEITFRFDPTVQRAARIEELLDQITKVGPPEAGKDSIDES